MTRTRHQPPSRLRYAAQHPCIGVHVDVPTRDRLLELRRRSGLSFGQLVKQALGLLEKDVGSAWELGRKRGLEEGRQIGFVEGRDAALAKARSAYLLTYPCSVCGEPVEILRGSDSAEAAVAALVEDRWAHGRCLEPRGLESA